MGVGLYDTAFAALGRIYGTDARSAITGIMLIAGGPSRHGAPASWAGARRVLPGRSPTSSLPCR